MTTEVFRVAVSGRFGELSDATRARLVRSAAEHDPVLARFGDEPNLTYRATLDVWSIRLEVRVDGDDPHATTTAERIAIAESLEFLRVLGIPTGTPRARVSTMSHHAP